VAEILYQFEQPLTVSHAKFEAAFGATPTPTTWPSPTRSTGTGAPYSHCNEFTCVETLLVERHLIGAADGRPRRGTQILRPTSCEPAASLREDAFRLRQAPNRDRTRDLTAALRQHTSGSKGGRGSVAAVV
jgi:hypothetical protein